MRGKRHILIPGCLLIYLGVMAYVGLGGLKSGETSALKYFLTLGITLGVIVVLYFTIRRRERLRAERLKDINKNEDNNE